MQLHVKSLKLRAAKADDIDYKLGGRFLEAFFAK